MKRLHIVILTVLICLLFLGAWLAKRAGTRGEEDAFRLPPACETRDVREILIQFANAESGEAAAGSREPSSSRIRVKRTDTLVDDLPETVSNLRATWEILEPPLGEADALFMQRIVGDLCFIPTAQRIKDADLVSLGLGNPKAIVEFSIEKAAGLSSQKRVFQFGVPLPERRVAMRTESDQDPGLTYSIPEKFFQWLTVPAERFQNRRVLRMPLDRIDSLSVRAPNGSRFTLERAGSDWRLLDQNQAELNSNPDAIARFVNRLATLRALEIVEQGVSPVRCRQLAKTVELRFEAIDRSTEFVYFSSPDEKENSGRLVACGSERKPLFSVHRDMWKFLDVTTASFRRRAAGS